MYLSLSITMRPSLTVDASSKELSKLQNTLNEYLDSKNRALQARTDFELAEIPSVLQEAREEFDPRSYRVGCTLNYETSEVGERPAEELVKELNMVSGSLQAIDNSMYASVISAHTDKTPLKQPFLSIGLTRPAVSISLASLLALGRAK